MKKICLILTIICNVFLCSCFDYNDINRLIFVTAIVIDIDDGGHPILYSEVFTSTRVSGEKMGREDRMIFKSEGTSLLDAVKSINLCSNYKLNYTQNKAIIFTEKAAKYGVDNFIDVLDRDQEFLLRQYVFILSGEPEEFMKTELVEEKYTGVFLSELVLNSSTTSKASMIRLDEFLNNRRMGSRVNVVNTVGIDKNQLENKICIKGLAVIKDDKLVDKLTTEEGMAYNFMNNTFKQGNIEIENPEHRNRFVSLELLRSKTKSSLAYEDKKINIKKLINTRTSFGGTQKSFQLTDYENRETVSKEAENYIEKSCKKLFDRFKEKDIDIFNFKREFEIRYPNEKIEDIMSMVNLEVEAKVTIEGSSDRTNFK